MGVFMDDPVTASANAAGAIAKTTGQALDVIHDTGGYLRGVFGDVPTDLIGVLGGAWLHEHHKRLRDALRRRTEQILQERDVKEAVELSPNIAAALIAGAQEEGREELMELWARLLASAMNPATRNDVRHSFIEVLKVMDPTDALVLAELYKRNLSAVSRGGTSRPETTTIHNLAEAINRRSDDVETSVKHLSSLGFFDPANQEWFATAFNREFMRSCYPEVKAQ
jgi:hypothetical protein